MKRITAYLVIFGALVLGTLLCAMDLIAEHLPELAAIWAAFGLGAYLAGVVVGFLCFIASGGAREPPKEQLTSLGLVLVWPYLLTMILHDEWSDATGFG